MNENSQEYDLLRKNELTFTHIALDGANLTDIAHTVAAVMQLDPSEVLVTDYLDNVMTLDILRDSIYPHQVIARKDQLLANIRLIPGVTLQDNAEVTSEGMLGWIAANEEDALAAIARADEMAAEIRARLAKRAIIFSTGAEVVSGEIEDTNRHTIAGYLEASGYTATFGGTLADDRDLIAGKIRAGIEEGHTIVITTGGVGAESKDCTVEAVEDVDHRAATPYICTFRKGHGRHVKDGVRIGVGQLDDAIVIALPGPNDEVEASMPLVIQALENRPGKDAVAEALAANLRDILRHKMQHHTTEGEDAYHD